MCKGGGQSHGRHATVTFLYPGNAAKVIRLCRSGIKSPQAQETSGKLYFVASGSHTTTSASAPGMMRPLRGYRLRILAALELVTATKRFSSIFPPTWNVANVSDQPGSGRMASSPGTCYPACGLSSEGHSCGPKANSAIGTVPIRGTGQSLRPCLPLHPSLSHAGDLCLRLSAWGKCTP